MLNSKITSMLNWLVASFITLVSVSGCAEQKPQFMGLHEDNLPVNAEPSLDTATFGAGCFWCVETLFERLNGVEKVISGYSGGHIENPSYEQVCSKTSGHVEVVQVHFDRNKISFDDLLEVFWKTHDPTTPNKQGNDEGPQYRSVVFFNDEAQRKTAEEYKALLDKSGAWDRPIVTTIEPLKNFYKAEAYHQDYYNNNTTQPYCRYVIQPKLEKFEKVFRDKLKQ